MAIFELVFIPCPGMSHLVSTVEVAKLLLIRDRRLSITVLIMNSTNDQTTEKYLQNLSPASNPHSHLKFVNLTTPDGPSPSIAASFHSIDGHASRIRELVSDMIKNSPGQDTRLAGLVVDIFCTKFIEIGDELGLPSYVFSASGASFLGLAFNLVRLKFEENEDLTRYKGSDIELTISCFSKPIPAKVLPAVFINGGPLSTLFLTYFKRMEGARGIVVNTFRDLEPFVIRALQSDDKNPRIYPVGPILNSGPEGQMLGGELKDWLDEQPERSVVFLCFGTMGSFERDQVREIATALEGSKARFLWSLRKPGPDKLPGMMPVPTEYNDFRDVLPEGFLERTRGMGKVIGWAPQVSVLAHRAVGGFVSHCGWNSILESVWHGVPVAAFPLFAEQQLNAFHLVKELGMAEAVRLDYRKDLGREGLPEIVGAVEIEVAVRRLMAEGLPKHDLRSCDGKEEEESVVGKIGSVREKVREMRVKSRAALEEGGSSYDALTSFIEDVITNVGG